jgi:hypothetical protein
MANSRKPEHYEYSDDDDEYYYYDEEVKEESFSEICHEFEYSILFFMVVAVIGICFVIYGIVLVTRRRNYIFYGFDIIYGLIFICAAIR